LKSSANWSKTSRADWKQPKIVLAEAQEGWHQCNWRPLLMVTFAGLVVARYW